MSDSIATAISEMRRSEGQKSLMAFSKGYFPDLMDKPCSKFHREACEILERASIERGCYVAIAAPRGHAKSTFVSLFYPLWAACYGLERCIVIFSGTERLVRELIGHISREVKQNPRLRRDFPEVFRNAKCRRDSITLGNGVLIVGASVGQEVRGLRSAQGRPSLLIADDIEMTEHYRSAEGRERVREWFTNTVMPMGDAKTNVIVAGTIHHRDALMAHLTAPDEYPGWEKRVYRAMEARSVHPERWEEWKAALSRRTSFEGKDGRVGARLFFQRHEAEMLEGTRVLWPEVDSYYDLMLYVASKGLHSFNSEKQNQPVDPDTGAFPPKSRICWEDTFPCEGDLRAHLGSNVAVFGACDPSTGQGRDYSGIVVALKDLRDGWLYIVHAEHGRLDLQQLGQAILALCRRYRFTAFAFEANAFQSGWGKTIEQEVRKAGFYLPLKPVKHATNKEARILRLQPLVNGGTIRFSRNVTPLHDELTYFPKGENDDLVDALSMLVEIAEAPPFDPNPPSDPAKKPDGGKGPIILAPGTPGGYLDVEKEGLDWLIDDYK